MATTTGTRTRISVAETRCAHADVIVSRPLWQQASSDRMLEELTPSGWQGSEALRGKLLGSGPVLKKIDLLVAEIAWIVAQRTVVTVAFDTFTRLRPVFHGDFVRLEGRALSTNRSSVVCQASVYRRDWASGEFQLTHNAIVTFVAIDARTGRASGGLPELFDPQRPVQCRQLRELAEQRKKLSARWREAQEAVRALASTQRITHAMIPALDGGEDGAMPARLVDIRDTVVETRNNFLLKHANLNRNVFGGVLLDWMDRAALYCARNLTKNYNMVTVGMNRVHFKLPINLDNLVSIRSRVCRVKKFSVEVEIAVYRVELPHNTQQLSHTGYFEVLNLEDDNRQREIHLGVTAMEDDQEGMAALLRAFRRQQFEAEDAELLSMTPIPVSTSNQFTDDPAPVAKL